MLDDEDLEVWSTWMRAATVHATTRAFTRHVDSAKWAVEKAIRMARDRGLPESYGASVSAGKDSTVMWHLLAVEMGLPFEAVSEKDDLDYPGEESYLAALSSAWGAPVRIVRPPISPAAFIEDMAKRGDLRPGDDIHGRSAALSKACFYNVITEAVKGYSVSALGLRAEESGTRRTVIQELGRSYELRGKAKKGHPRQIRCNPVGGWSGIDVYAYAVSRGFDLLHVYRCVGFHPEHRAEPFRVRKSWWLPGAESSRGQVAWLFRYYPSLYERMRGWMPHASMFR